MPHRLKTIIVFLLAALFVMSACKAGNADNTNESAEQDSVQLDTSKDPDSMDASENSADSRDTQQTSSHTTEDNDHDEPEENESVTEEITVTDSSVDHADSDIPNSSAELQQLLENEISGMASEWDVWFENLKTGDCAHVLHNTSGPMVSASIIKLFIMGCVCEYIDQGILSADSVSSDLYSMITVSDNSAANRLISVLGNGDADAGMKAVNEWAASIGCKAVSLNRLMLQENGLQNYVSAEDCALLLRSIYNHTCVSEKESERMLELLKAQQVNDRIPQGVPAGVVCAHKTGNLSSLCIADVGILFSDKGDFLICAICNYPNSDSAAANEIVKITSTMYNHCS